MSQNPIRGSALGAKYERGKRYAVTHKPESNTSLLLSCDEEFIKRVETFFKEAGFTVARIYCGTSALLRQLLFVTGGGGGKTKEISGRSGSHDPLHRAQSKLCLLTQPDRGSMAGTAFVVRGMERRSDSVIELIKTFKSI